MSFCLGLALTPLLFPNSMLDNLLMNVAIKEFHKGHCYWQWEQIVSNNLVIISMEQGWLQVRFHEIIFISNGNIFPMFYHPLSPPSSLSETRRTHDYPEQRGHFPVSSPLQLPSTLKLSLGHYVVSINNGEPEEEGNLFDSPSSDLAGIQMWWLKSKQPPCSKRETPGVEAARTVKGKEPGSFMTVWPSGQPGVACVHVGEIQCCLFWVLWFGVFWFLLQ